MTINGVLWRFAVSYVVVVFVAGLALNYLGIKSGSAVNIAALAACTSWVCAKFGKENGRYFTSSEKVKVVLGLLVIDLALQFLVAFAVMPQRPSDDTTGILFFVLMVVGLLHALAIYLFVSFAGRSLVKQGVISG